VRPSVAIVCACEGVVDEQLGNRSDGTVEYTLHRRLVSELYQAAAVHVQLPPEQSVSKSRSASSSSRSRSC
jgi:hypothetical protein